MPGFDDDQLGFDDDPVGIGEPHDWDRRDVWHGDVRTTFTRRVVTDTTGEQVAVIDTNCDPPDLVLLARKGDVDYLRDGWRDHPDEHRLWAAEITRQMLEEGLVATRYDGGMDGPHAAMTAAVNDDIDPERFGRHALTGVVAQIRGLRVLQSLAPSTGDVHTMFAGRAIPISVQHLLNDCFENTLRTYRTLPQPPWTDTDPPGTPWGAQLTAGYATNTSRDVVFVGEHGDLVWRALTETDLYGRSPLKKSVLWATDDADRREMIVAAGLYDETAQAQLTTGLFDGVRATERVRVHYDTLGMFESALNPSDSGCRWSVAQQDKLRWFIDMLKK